MKIYQEKKRLEKVEKNRERTQKKGLKPGPSGKPIKVFVQAQSKGVAKDIATDIGELFKKIIFNQFKQWEA